MNSKSIAKDRGKDGGNIYKSQKTNEGFETVRKIFDGDFRKVVDLPPFADCTVDQLCNFTVFENFAKHLKTMKQKNGESYAPKSLTQYFSGFKNMVQNKLKSEKPSFLM